MGKQLTRIPLLPLVLLELREGETDLPEVRDGETDFTDTDLFEDNDDDDDDDKETDLFEDKDDEIEEGMLNGFSFTVGVFFKLALCKSET